MEKKYLIVNLGSASKKYAIYSAGGEKLSVHIEKKDESDNDFISAIDSFILSSKAKNIIKYEEEISAIGFRVVASGSYFRTDRIIDEEYLKNLKKVMMQSPLHLRLLIDEIKHLEQVFSKTPMIGISDSAFHSTLTKNSLYYNIPIEDSEKMDIYRFGYHGIAVQSALKEIEMGFGSIPAKVIIVHLGGGSSITAIKDGKSFDTSMGFSPLEGVPMGTRSGNIDVGAIMYLMEKKSMNLDGLNYYLNTKCGLLGLSGKTSSVKELLMLESSGDVNAKFALDVLVYQIQKYIGAYLATLGGLDMLVFSGTISEKSPHMRSRIIEGLKHFGLNIDSKKNIDLNNKSTFIEAQNSKIKIIVTYINEAKEIAIRTEKYFASNKIPQK